MSSHEENRKKICLYCTKKVNKQKFNINESLLDKVKRNVLAEYDPTDQKYPTILCSTCRYWIDKMEKGERAKERPVFDYKNMNMPLNTRSNKDEPCNCMICSTARQKGNKVVYMTTTEAKVTQNKETIIICNICFGEIHKGKGHECGEKCIPENIVALLSNVSHQKKEQVISSLLDSIAMDKKRNNLISLATRGKRKSIIMNPEVPQKKMFMKEDFIYIKQLINLSNNQLFKVATWIRGVQGMFILKILTV